MQSNQLVPLTWPHDHRPLSSELFPSRRHRPEVAFPDLADRTTTSPGRRSLRVAHVSDYYFPRLGGIEVHIAALSAAQRRAGHAVDVVSAGGVVEDGDGRVAWASSRKGSTFESYSPRAIDAAVEAIVGGGYDAVHIHAGLATPLSFTVAATASRAGIPTVVTMHSMVGGFGMLYRGLDRLTGWREWPVAWTSVSHVAAAQLQTVLGQDSTVDVLTNAIDVEKWHAGSTRVHEGIVIAAVMRLAPRKRAMPLLGLLRKLRQTTPAAVPIRVVIIGEGPERSAMNRYLARHDMDRWVSLRGVATHDEIRELFGAADIFVAPAVKESFGLAALEARAAGLPVVAMAKSGINEFIDHGQSGLLVDGDAGMVEALRSLVTDAELRDRIAAHNRRVAPAFGWAQALRRTDDLYSRAATVLGTTLGDEVDVDRSSSLRAVPSPSGRPEALSA